MIHVQRVLVNYFKGAEDVYLTNFTLKADCQTPPYTSTNQPSSMDNNGCMYSTAISQSTSVSSPMEIKPHLHVWAFLGVLTNVSFSVGYKINSNSQDKLQH